MSKFNYVERCMAPLSKVLSEVVNIQSFPYSNHLNPQGNQVIKKDLAIQNHDNALFKLSRLFSKAIYNNQHPHTIYIPPNTPEPAPSHPKLPLYSKFVDYFDKASHLTAVEKVEVEKVLAQIEKHTVYTPYSFTIKGCSEKAAIIATGTILKMKQSKSCSHLD
eukprot:TRINITY_DN7471_c0_g1_i1.p1 TRINITY_DN7471_c0_g1~~TRINITY_DN7471_c0_g1_i1.p1  ORF type:complete len:163 (-),score=36.87 TRINITY_DN7471_c0_g1_i1:374-862(-)